MSTRRPSSLAEVAQRVTDGQQKFGPALAEFLDAFYLDTDEGRQHRLDAIPTATDDSEADAWIGAAGEHLAQRWGLLTPSWTRGPRYAGLPFPRFYPATTSLQLYLLASSPPAFRQRNIFTAAEPLMRARFPAGQKAVLPFETLDSGQIPA